MARVVSTCLAAMVVAALTVSSAQAGDPHGHSHHYYYSPGAAHAALHDELEHRAYHREVEHRQAHRYPMIWWQHQRLHGRLDHEAFHDRLEHRAFHYSLPGTIGYRYGLPRATLGIYGPGVSFWYSR